MREPLLALAMVCTAAGLMLGFHRRRWIGVVAAFLLAGFSMRLHPAADFTQLLAWAAVMLCSAGTWLGSATPRILALGLAAAAGFCAGLLIGDGRGLTLLAAIPAGALVSAFATAHGRALFVKVTASWLMAIACLNAALPLLPVTPGYAPDHLE